MTALTQLLTKTRELEAKCTKGPWFNSCREKSGYAGCIRSKPEHNREVAFVQGHLGGTGGSFYEPDAQIIVHSRNVILALVDIIERQRVEVICYCEKLHPDIGGKCGTCYMDEEVEQIAAKALGEGPV